MNSPRLSCVGKGGEGEVGGWGGGGGGLGGPASDVLVTPAVSQAVGVLSVQIVSHVIVGSPGRPHVTSASPCQDAARV